MPVSNKTIANDSSGVVANARIAAGLDQIIRCASTDMLAKVVVSDDNNNHPNNHDRKSSNLKASIMDTSILQRAGLILDLRSPSERNERRAQLWMSSIASSAKARGEGNTSRCISNFVACELLPHKFYSEGNLQAILDKQPRVAIRLDILSPTRFMAYLEQNWLSPAEQIQANELRKASVEDGDQRLHHLRIQTLNQRGLMGLNEAILETGKNGLCTAIQLITLFLEGVATQQQQRDTSDDSSPPSSLYHLIVIHCVQGKDRTGLLVMLCQAIMGVSEEDIVEDYHRSHNNIRSRRKRGRPNNNGETSAAMQRVTTAPSPSKSAVAQQPAKWDPSIFLGAPRHVMQSTLDFLRSRYGSVSPGYLNHIGFDSSWQRRSQQAHRTTACHNKEAANLSGYAKNELPIFASKL